MPSFRLLSPDMTEKIHKASLWVLEHTGILLDPSDQELRDELIRAGAETDGERVIMPAAMVEAALSRVSHSIQMYDRNGKESILIENGQTHFGPGSDAMYNYDKTTGRLFPTDDADMPRWSTLGDVRDNVRIADALGFDFIMSMGLPHEVDAHRLYPTVFAEMVKNTAKPLVFTSTRLEEIRAIRRISRIAASDPDGKPFAIAYLEPISPLRFDPTVTSRLRYCARENIPVAFAAGANCGGGAPITPEGGVVQGNAECLAGIVIAALYSDQPKLIYGANTSAMDMNTMIVCYGAPEWFRTVAMYAEMGRFYGLPSWGTGGCTDARVINSQAGMEAYEGILMALLSSSTMVHDVGFLGHGEVYHPGMLVLSKAMIDRARFLIKEPDMSSEALALEVIHHVSRHKGYLYLADAHSAKNFGSALWLAPRFFEKGYMEDWDANSFQDRLTEEANKVLATAAPDLLDDRRAAEIDGYLASLDPEDA